MSLEETDEHMMQYTTRRRFLLTTTGLALSPALARGAHGEGARQDGKRMLPTVEFGSSGRSLPRLGLGTYPLGTLPDEDAGVAVIDRAITLGARYLDTAPSYSRGRAEERIGIALTDRPREDFFIATKTLARDADGARRELEASLRRLKTDYVDSIQVHALRNDVETLFGEDAVLAGLTKTKEEGLAKHIGITAHFNPKYLLEACRRHDVFNVLMPVNPLDTKHNSFIRRFLPFAIDNGIAVVAMKVYAGGGLLAKLSVDECVHYALSQEGVDVIVPGCKSVQHVEEAYAATMSYEPLSAETQRSLEEKAGPHEGRSSEWYKDTVDNDE